MVYYKGFNSDMTCRGFQYVEGESYTTNHAELCQTGFHACPMPLDTLRYYPLATSIYHQIELGADAAGDGDKRVSRHITIGAKINIAGMIKAHLKLVWEKVDKEPHPAATSGDYSTAATSGDESTAATSGDESTAATSGDYSTAATSGNYSTAATSGDWSTAATSGGRSTAATSGDESTAATSGNWSTAAVEGKDSIAVAAGFACKARGALGCWLVLAERNDKGEILDVQAVRVDGDTIKPDTLYTLTGGCVTEVGADE